MSEPGPSPAPSGEGLFAAAREARERHYGKKVYFRGLIEFSNHCKNDCLYCGIRRSNGLVRRYRLSPEEILACCDSGAKLGFRTFVLQSGEDPWFTDDRIVSLVGRIRESWPDHAITLSIGEKSRKSYLRYFRAGADRYLLRHETADDGHYRRLHPPEMSPENRRRCLFDLKDIGYQVGAGFMVGSPFQTEGNLEADLRFLEELRPDMAGIGPFIPARGTPFAGHPAGNLDLTLRMIARTRILLPAALIPATTALGTAAPDGRERGILAGANVVMPNLSPGHVRKLYSLYDDKICTGEEAAECRLCIQARILGTGHLPDMGRGDAAGR